MNTMNMTIDFFKYHKFLCLLVSLMLLLLALSACTPQLATRGNLVSDDLLHEIKPGIDTRDDVAGKIGSPTTIAPFDENTWYYMGQRTEKKGILDPALTKERVVIVRFTPEGVVDRVAERQGGREEIPIVQRTTPTSGNDFTFIQQMLGNLGKFNSQPESAARTAGGL